MFGKVLFLIATASVYASEDSWDSRVTNGKPAASGEFPYQISLQQNRGYVYEHICGGAILSPTWVLTAYHCIPKSSDKLRIVAGITSLEDAGQVIQVTHAVTPHSGYDTIQFGQTINIVNSYTHHTYPGEINPSDIALLKLAIGLKFNTLVKPIGLPVVGRVPSGNATFSGWGFTSNHPFPTRPSILQTATVPIQTYSECSSAVQRYWGSGYLLRNNINICTGGPNVDVSICDNDGGSPLVQDGSLVGVASWGYDKPCGTKGAPSVYVQVSNFVTFILDHVTDI